LPSTETDGGWWPAHAWHIYLVIREVTKTLSLYRLNKRGIQDLSSGADYGECVEREQAYRP